MQITPGQQGIAYALLAQFIWGVGPIYFKTASVASHYEIFVYRIITSFFILCVIYLLLHRTFALKIFFSIKNSWPWLLASTTFLFTNWYLFIWSISKGRFIDVSLAYFISPVIISLIGYLFLRDRLHLLQKIAIALTVLGVLYQLVLQQTLSLSAIILSISFSLYGLIKKYHPIPAINGLFFEITIMLVPTALFVFWLTAHEHYQFTTSFSSISTLLITGPITCIPFLCHITAARKITLSTLGTLQFIGPLITFFVGIFVYNESTQGGWPSIILILFAQFLFICTALFQMFKETYNPFKNGFVKEKIFKKPADTI